MNIVHSVSCIHCQIHRSDLAYGRQKGEEQRRGGGQGGMGRVALRRQGQTGNKNSATPFYIAKAEAAARNHCLSHSPLSFEKTNSLSLSRVKLLCILQKLTQIYN